MLKHHDARGQVFFSGSDYLEGVVMPDEFHLAAADIYARLADLRCGR
ncbi:MAG: hypothetical protein ABIJ65_12045 [Chloroflexota bacterium]